MIRVVFRALILLLFLPYPAVAQMVGVGIRRAPLPPPAGSFARMRPPTPAEREASPLSIWTPPVIPGGPPGRNPWLPPAGPPVLVVPPARDALIAPGGATPTDRPFAVAPAGDGAHQNWRPAVNPARRATPYAAPGPIPGARPTFDPDEIQIEAVPSTNMGQINLDPLRCPLCAGPQVQRIDATTPAGTTFPISPEVRDPTRPGYIMRPTAPQVRLQTQCLGCGNRSDTVTVPAEEGPLRVEQRNSEALRRVEVRAAIQGGASACPGGVCAQIVTGRGRVDGADGVYRATHGTCMGCGNVASSTTGPGGFRRVVGPQGVTTSQGAPGDVDAANNAVRSARSDFLGAARSLTSQPRDRH